MDSPVPKSPNENAKCYVLRHNCAINDKFQRIEQLVLLCTFPNVSNVITLLKVYLLCLKAPNKKEFNKKLNKTEEKL